MGSLGKVVKPLQDISSLPRDDDISDYGVKPNEHQLPNYKIMILRGISDILICLKWILTDLYFEKPELWQNVGIL